jgi:hypothetical protein
MPKPPTPQALQREILEDINWMAGPLAKPNPKRSDRLDVVFGLTAYQRRALAAPFEHSVARWNPEARISRAECERLTTVGAAVALASAAAGFDGSWV